MNKKLAKFGFIVSLIISGYSLASSFYITFIITLTAGLYLIDRYDESTKGEENVKTDKGSS